MAKGSSVKDVDLGYKKILKMLKEIDDSFVTVGVHEGAEDYKNGMPVVGVAAIHEFGGETESGIVIPERAPMRKTVDQKEKEWFALLKKLKDAVLNGKKSVKTAFNQFGIIVTEAFKSTISDYDRAFPGLPLAPSTIKQKKSQGSPTKPLVRTFKYRDSITHEVTIKK